jgi:alpha-glucosidase (family GH31 glycosyl hydrolase)
MHIDSAVRLMRRQLLKKASRRADLNMVGDRMMVVPLFAGEPNRKVVIPSGRDWHDFWTGAGVKGGTDITVEASAQNIPIYIKTGSIIPWADVGRHAGARETRRLAAGSMVMVLFRLSSMQEFDLFI